MCEPEDFAPRKLIREQAKMEQRLYWSRKTIPERLAAMTALNERMYRMRGIRVDEQKADLTVSRVRRRKLLIHRLRDLADAEELALIPDETGTGQFCPVSSDHFGA